MVKRYHPDVNGGDRSAEERLAQVIRAYNTLKKTNFS
jgi:curved DNA-binding protein CbpA